jgi:hypothetical protein
MEPGNVLIYRDDKFGHHRYYEVLGVFLGGEESESLVELRSLGEKPGYGGGAVQLSTVVPEVLTRHLERRDSIASLITD